MVLLFQTRVPHIEGSERVVIDSSVLCCPVCYDVSFPESKKTLIVVFLRCIHVFLSFSHVATPSAIDVSGQCRLIL